MTSTSLTSGVKGQLNSCGPVSYCNGSESDPYLPLYIGTEGSWQSQWGSPGRSSTSWELSRVKNCWNREFSSTRLLQHKGLSSCSGNRGTLSATCLCIAIPEHWIHCIFCALGAFAPLEFFLFCLTQCWQWGGANERRCPSVDVWHSILQLPIKVSWFASKKNACRLVLAQWTEWSSQVTPVTFRAFKI